MAPRTPSLEMLTAHDWALLDERMKPHAFPRGAPLLQEGVHRRALMIVRSGTVRVERSTRGRALVLSQLGAGEVLGEIGFVEDRPASASVVAEEACVVDVIEGDALQSLIAAEPGFAARFYHSLAIALARRTRSADLARLAAAGTDAIARVNRFHAPRVGNISARQIPPALSEALESFERSMLATTLALRAGGDEAGEAASVGAACDRVVALLEEFTVDGTLVDIGYSDLLAFRDAEQLEAGVGDWIFRETYPTFMQSATMARCQAKPRGFSDDFETMQTIYRDQPEGDGRLGPLIDRWFLGRPLCRSRRAAADTLRLRLGDAIAASPGRGMRVASLASGAAAELFDHFAQHPSSSDPSSSVRTTCIDLDDEALVAGAHRAAAAGLAERMTFVEGNVVPGHREGPSLLSHDFVYALGLCEYLDDDRVVALLDYAWSIVAPGGTLVVTNLADGNPDRGVMCHLLDWQAHHRTVDDLRSLFARSACSGRPVEVDVDRWNVTLFARCSKSA